MSDPIAPRNILVIDDQESSRYIIQRILTKAGFLVQEAATGREGLRKATEMPDLVISDVNLPDILGYEIVRRLKSNPLTASIPVIQMSASFVSDESKIQGLEGGADSYLTQPIEPSVLVAQVNALLRMRKAESLSHLSALQWQTTFDTLSDGLALVDAEDRLIRANTAFLQFMKLTHPEVKGRTLAALFESRFDVSFHDFANRSNFEKPVELTWDRRWFRVRYDLIKADLDQTSGSILILTDITNNKKLEETLKLSERLAATGRLAHIIAHEINNPLEAMSNLLYLAAQDDQDRIDVQSYVEQASNELRRISTITKQILGYHRDAMAPFLVSSGEIIESVLAMLRTHLTMKGVTLESQIVCFDAILAQPGELRQVFNNIIMNAVDAMALNNRTLRVRCIASKSYKTNCRGVRFIFSDSGSGIAQEIVPRVFEAFFTTKEGKGSGIGLWLSGGVIAKHNGLVRIRTRTSGSYIGTIFDVFIPFPAETS